MSRPELRFDFSNAFAPRCADSPLALEEGERSRAFERAREIGERVRVGREAGAYGFLDLVRPGPELKEILSFADSAAQRFDNYVNLGIGGSSLGAIALMGLKGPLHNQTPAAQRVGMRCYFPENVDPSTFSDLLANLDPTRTVFGVVSKSGSTAETMAQFLIARKWLVSVLGEVEADRHTVFVTDKEAGLLRPWAREKGLTAFTIPDGVGGRFSVLSPVGLLPAALMGLDVGALLEGAQRMALRCDTTDPETNPALAAAAIYAGLMEKGARMTVLFPYADALGGFARWAIQLISESLGKRVDREGRVVNEGVTPLAAIGATDQHSQLQLFMEGPHDKMITLIGLDSQPNDIEIPEAPPEIAEMGYLSGHTLGELLEAERMATETALTKNGRPNMTISLPKWDEAALGGLFVFYEMLTVYLGEWLNIDAFDQPGVEAGKRYAYGLMGREGYSEQAEEVRRFAESGEKRED